MNRMTEKGKKQLEALVAQVMEDCSARGVAVGIVNAKGECSGSFAFGGKGIQEELLRKDGIEVVNGRVDLKKYEVDVQELTDHF